MTRTMTAALALALAGGARAEAQTPTPTPGAVAAVWANDGGDKVCREELRATADPAGVANGVWDGETVRLSGARNEVVAFALILEAPARAASGVSVILDRLEGPGGAAIASTPASGDGVYAWVGRNIELFYVRYLPIRGLSAFGYSADYDERHVPAGLRRPWTGNGVGEGTWYDRPNHDRSYPDIAVPLEWVGAFDVPEGTSQAVWVDVYVPKDAPSGLYGGTLAVSEEGVEVRSVPVELAVRDFSLPDVPSAKTMVHLGYRDVNERYLGLENAYPNPGALDDLSDLVRDRHFLLAHRHKISLIDANDSAEAWGHDRPRPEWIPRLDGSLFSAARGYDGPGAETGNGVFSIGTYHSWYGPGWDEEAEMRAHTDAWESWFAANAPGTERFLYLIDESGNFAEIEEWASWIDDNPGPGRALLSFATIALPDARDSTPSLDIPASTLGVGIADDWEDACGFFAADPGKRVYMYNGKRPAAGTLVTEDDGVALRATAWAQHKKGIDRWFVWHSTYYWDYQTCGERVDLFSSAKTFGCDSGFDGVRGRTGYLYTNGDGVLFYPGTDAVHPASSYGVAGPIASLRLKHWRRGIQDVDYLALASAIDPARVAAIVDGMVPKALWEYGVDNPSDPTYVHTDISWPTDPDAWEAAREELAGIIEGAAPSFPVRVNFQPAAAAAPAGFRKDGGAGYGAGGAWGWR